MCLSLFICACGLIGACGPTRAPQAVVPSETTVPESPQTELEKNVELSAKKVSAVLRKWGLDRADLHLDATANPACAAPELERELAELLAEALKEGDTASRIELERSRTALTTCENGGGSALATSARAHEIILLLGDGRVLEAERRYEEERAWLRRAGGASGAARVSNPAEALLTENWINGLIFAGLLGKAYATFDQESPLLRRERGPETTQLLLRLALWACLHGRASLSATYAEQAQAQIGRRELEGGSAVTMAQVAGCLISRGDVAGSRLGSWATASQATFIRQTLDRSLALLRTVQLGQAEVALLKHKLAAETFRRVLAEIGEPPTVVTDPEFSSFVLATSELARLEAAEGNLAEARATLQPFPKEALDTLGPTLDRALGRFSAAKKGWEVIEERSRGYGAPFRVLWMTEGARLAWAEGSAQVALDRFQAALDLAQKHAAENSENGSEEDRRRAGEPLLPVVSTLVAAHLHKWQNDEGFARSALEAIWLTQANVLTSVVEDAALLRERDPRLLAELKAAREALAKRSIAATSATSDKFYKERLELEQLEAKARQTTRQFRRVPPALTSREVQAKLKPGEVLLTFFEFGAEKPDALPHQAERHFAVYGLRQKGMPFALDLGKSRDMEQKVGALRRALVPGGSGYRDAARSLGDLAMAPWIRKLEGISTLKVTPAGALNLVPLAALLGDKDQPYIERFSITYLTSARQAMTDSAPSARQKTTSPPWIAAAPDFGGAAGAAKSPFSLSSRGARSPALGNITWEPLPGALREGQALLRIFPKAKLVQGEMANEAQVKAVSSPLILHLATHGYFLPEAAPLQNSLIAPLTEDPLLHSGLVLTGANRGGSNGEDGYLTALELASVDLYQTELATLSACETGLGYVGGEGVHGLRRALQMAGAKSQLLSLWNVDDDATLELMMAFYERLLLGEGRAEALRNVQRAMFAGKSPAPLSSKRPRSKSQGQHRAPYFWAAFVLSGESGPLNL